MDWININNVLSKIKARPGIKNSLQAQLLKEKFKKIFGIEDVALLNGKLELKIRSSVLAQELSFKKEDIRQEVVKILGHSIKEVKIRKI